jgi:hypothetical protein
MSWETLQILLETVFDNIIKKTNYKNEIKIN